ncbi:hypothetical protein J1605_007483 [Eschrichtius robustus]|uniref:Uncharacterized protein n=1 Tax=Eschrichtius robustus TaxID=9764 RepID=A0AB34H142_ESCRO|nr:hypothetical protein J1605_007483 [Eschrichtius robustus]
MSHRPAAQHHGECASPSTNLPNPNQDHHVNPMQVLMRKATTDKCTKNTALGTTLVAQWLRIRLPMQGTGVRALVREDPTCCGATKPMCHSY